MLLRDHGEPDILTREVFPDTRVSMGTLVNILTAAEHPNGATGIARLELVARDARAGGHEVPQSSDRGPRPVPPAGCLHAHPCGAGTRQ
jgi:hypothetical protein